jgi:hypothetical protein
MVWAEGAEPSRAYAQRIFVPAMAFTAAIHTRPFAEHRKGDWISDMKSNKSGRGSARSKNDRLRSALLSPLVGYMRVSKADGSQVLDLQRDALIAAGVAERNIYSDTASRKKDDRPGLYACLKAVRAGRDPGQRHRSQSGRQRKLKLRPTPPWGAHLLSVCVDFALNELQNEACAMYSHQVSRGFVRASALFHPRQTAVALDSHP